MTRRTVLTSASMVASAVLSGADREKQHWGEFEITALGLTRIKGRERAWVLPKVQPHLYSIGATPEGDVLVVSLQVKALGKATTPNPSRLIVVHLDGTESPSPLKSDDLFSPYIKPWPSEDARNCMREIPFVVPTGTDVKSFIFDDIPFDLQRFKASRGQKSR